MSILEDPPDDNEAFANLDESLDDADAVGGESGGGPEGTRDLDTDLVVDQAELEELGANLDDPEQMSILEGGMDDPDGVEPSGAARSDDDAGWDVDPVVAADKRSTGEGTAVGAEGDAITDDLLVDVPELADDPELELVDTADLEQVPDDAPGSDSARW